MHARPDTVPVNLDLPPAVAAALLDPATRERVERLVSRVVHAASIDRLFAAMDAVSDEARRRGLTDVLLQGELEAYNAEGRDRSPGA